MCVIMKRVIVSESGGGRWFKGPKHGPMFNLTVGVWCDGVGTIEIRPLLMGLCTLHCASPEMGWFAYRSTGRLMHITRFISYRAV